MIQRLAVWSYGAALVTLPWAGVGTVKLLTGADLGAGFQPSYLLLALSMCVHLIGSLGRSSVYQVRRSGVWASIPRFWQIWLVLGMGFLAALLISGLGIMMAPVVGEANTQWLRFLKQLVQVLVMAVFVVYPALWTRTERRWQWTIRCLMAGAAIQVLYSLFQTIHFYAGFAWFAGLESVFTSNPAILSGSEELFLGDSFRGIPRLRGTMCEPLYLGNFLLLIVPLVFLGGLSSRWRWPLAVGSVVLLILTWARGAYLGFAGVGLVAGILWWHCGFERPGRPLVIRFAGVLIVGAVLVLALGGTEGFLLPWQRLGQSVNLQDWSNLTRLYSMQAAWRGFLLSPVVGIGWGQFAFHFPVLVDPLGLQSQFSWPVVNNLPLQVLCETGLIGFLVLVVAAVHLGRSVWQGTRRVDGRTPEYRFRQRRVVAMAAAMSGIWLQLLTFSQYNLPHIAVAVGLSLAALRSLHQTEFDEMDNEGH